MIVEDNQRARRAIKALISQQAEVNVISEASNGQEAIQKIKAIYGQIKILFLSMYEHHEYVDYALKNGAKGFVIKDNLDLELSPAIEKIRCGETYLSPLVCSDRD